MSLNSSPVKGSHRISVLLPVPLAHTFDYISPHPLEPGTLVKAPFGSRQLYGIVCENKDALPFSKPLKSISQVVKNIRLPEVSLKFLEWVSDYTLTPRGLLLKMCLVEPEALEIKGEKLYGFSHPPQRLTLKRQQVIEYFKTSPSPLSFNEIEEKTGVSESILKALIKEGILTIQGESPWAPQLSALAHSPQKPQLSLDQLVAAEDIKKSLGKGNFQTFLLEGVTGSGKTEVYFEAIDDVVHQGGQALVMLPEIALSAQWVQRFQKRFGFEPSLWHSDLNKNQRKTTFRSLLEGHAQVVVGTRSALFLPFPNLKLIIVDEEHDGAYKQEEGVIYNGRDMAVVRARLGEIPCVLASATPSLETELNVQSGKYRALHLTSRYGKAELPQVHLIDLRQSPRKKGEAPTWIAPSLRKALEETLSRQEQGMLFLNRRGYAPLLLCQSCGHRLMCPSCSVSLVHHKFKNKLLCHHCNYTQDLIHTCPACQEEDTFSPLGPGVERIEEEVRTLFPHARSALMTSDHLTTPQKVYDLVQKIQNQEVDILIGTQIMAKGHHFPHLTLVGIIDGDSALSGSDLRAAEKSFQLLHQVAGRSGREHRQGQVFLQTHNPDHPVMQALLSQDRGQFFALEAEQRMIQGFPPYGRLTALILSGRQEREVQKAANLLARTFPLMDKAELLGPAPAPLAFLRGRHRWRLLLKTHKDYPPQPLLKHWLGKITLDSSVRLQMDIDPYSFF